MSDKIIKFSKLVASGNDFVLIDDFPADLKFLAKKLCDRKFGIGADGLLVICRSKRAERRMRIFNPDGSEAEMCGNGARCTAFYLAGALRKNKFSIETRAGIIKAEVGAGQVKVRLTDPTAIEQRKVRLEARALNVYFINTGVPHAIVFVQGLKDINVALLGSLIRYHKAFSPAGTNVDFVEVQPDASIKVRTYERGVEAETLACGTGMTASALVYAALYEPPGADAMVEVFPRSMEQVKVYFKREKGSFHDVWLQGKATLVFNGTVKIPKKEG